MIKSGNKGTSMIRKSRGKAEVSLPPQEAGPSWLNEYFADFFRSSLWADNQYYDQTSICCIRLKALSISPVPWQGSLQKIKFGCPCRPRNRLLGASRELRSHSPHYCEDRQGIGRCIFLVSRSMQPSLSPCM